MGYGFKCGNSMIGGVGACITRILPASPAGFSGQLSIGDRILAINGIPIGSLNSGDIEEIIVNSGLRIELTTGGMY